MLARCIVVDSRPDAVVLRYKQKLMEMENKCFNNQLITSSQNDNETLGSQSDKMSGGVTTVSRCCSAVTFTECVRGSTSLLAVRCTACTTNVAVLHDGVANDISDFLVDLSKPCGFHWIEARGGRERAVHLVLSQLVYCPEEANGQVPYDAPDNDDIIKLAWSDRQAVGFYTVKPAGLRSETEDAHHQTSSSECTPTLDTAFMLPSHRRRGLGSSLLSDFVSDYPIGALGLSHPLSDDMCAVVRRFLEKNLELRRRFWLVSGNGQYGDKTLIWLNLQRKSRT